VLSSPEKNPGQSFSVPCSGKLKPEIAVKIVHAETGVLLPDGYVGEIMAKGDSVSRGYWHKPEVNQNTFDLVVDGEPGYMATGDLGFVHNGYLYVSGRKKEMLIINGRNYYPQDIEHSLLALTDNLMAHGAAVFEVFNPATNSKEIVVVQELTRKAVRQDNHQEIIKNIRELIAEEHELKVNSVVLLKPATLAKTTSGKIQRIACRQAYINKELDAIASWTQEVAVNNNMQAPITDKTASGIAGWIINWIAVRLSVETAELSAAQQLTQIGLDSIDGMTLTHELAKQLELTLTPEVSWSYPTIEALANYLAEQVVAKSHNASTADETPTEGMI